MKVLLFKYTWKNPLSVVIRWATGSDYTHAAIHTDDGIFDASEKRGDVGVCDLSKYGGRIIVVFSAGSPDAVDYWVSSQLGRKYDWYGIFGWLFGHQKEEDVYCFEWVWEAIDIYEGAMPRAKSLSGDHIADRCGSSNVVFRGSVEKYRAL